MIRLPDLCAPDWSDARRDEELARVALDPSNRYMLATRAAAAMLEYMVGDRGPYKFERDHTDSGFWIDNARDNVAPGGDHPANLERLRDMPWPLENLALACIVSTQAELDRDWPIIVAVPAAMRGIVVQPTEAISLEASRFLQGSILYVGDEGGWEYAGARRGFVNFVIVEPPPPVECEDCGGSGTLGRCRDGRHQACERCGGNEDSAGSGYRDIVAVDVAWIRAIAEACYAAGVPCSVALVWPNLIENGITRPFDTLPADCLADDELWPQEQRA